MKRLLLALLVLAMPLMSASTGGIKGRVTDAKTGESLVGVNVIIEKHNLGASTDRKGNYKIINIPEGLYTVSATMIGYTPESVKKVKVKAGKIKKVNFKLKAQKIKGESVTVTATRPLDTKGRTSSKSTGSSSEVMTGSSSGKKPAKKDSEDTPPPKPGRLTRPRPSIPVESEETGSLDEEPTHDLFDAPESGGHAPPPPASDRTSFMVTPSDGKAKPTSRPAPPQSGGLKAGFADDNQQFNYFLNFLNQYRSSVNSYSYDISERIHLMLEDKDGKSLPNVNIKIFDGKESRLLDEGKTYADGSYFFYPSEVAAKDKTFYVGYTVNDVYQTVMVKRYGPRKITIQGEKSRDLQPGVPVDIVFILDTTGSMGEEIKRLIATIDLIHMNLSALSSKALIRFGMVLYRDKDDKYRTKVVPLTADIDEFRGALEEVRAGGGGDTPEDLQTALHKAMRNVDWNEDGLRLGFVITDASAHLDYGQRYTYISAALEAKKKGIKLFTVGTGGLGLRGEYVLRQISQLTYAKYLFLTYGKETGENTGGVTGSVSHHTGSNYQTDKLEAIIMRLAKEEISNFTDDPLEIDDGYFEAEKVDHESREETLSKLFKDAISNLIDYSTLKIEDSRRLGVLPIHPKTEHSGLSAEYFQEQVQLSVAQNNQFILIARKDLQAVLEEQKLQLSGLLTEAQTTKIGELLGAELLLAGELYEKEESYDLFLKLLRVETAEILAVTKIIIDKDLGL
ncbi:MAG: carboxypeptidase-like regulatory domain-containing protein [FCB group bacterium]|nr:carboxypeptidase-like regulatory domain-containing protein [FCB group bacterium]MBL7029354.1 carboxypeptidase-like regulatory domain-containing protein [Candidatus Neomarinimicrobiota bacterium]MBL7120711.1 carboxypeptidase-like regulatory domain-containing protein [Candidatus Neomarinimicrobiota bacterium]